MDDRFPATSHDEPFFPDEPVGLRPKRPQQPVETLEDLFPSEDDLPSPHHAPGHAMDWRALNIPGPAVAEPPAASTPVEPPRSRAALVAALIAAAILGFATVTLLLR